MHGISTHDVSVPASCGYARADLLRMDARSRNWGATADTVAPTDLTDPHGRRGCPAYYAPTFQSLDAISAADRDEFVSASTYGLWRLA